MKILHLALDDKFLDYAFPVFEKVYPGANDVIIFTQEIPLRYVQLRPDRIVITRGGFSNLKPKLSAEVYGQYDLVVFHSLASLIYAEAKNIPLVVPTVWLGWGADYYNDLLSGIPLLLDKTKILCSTLEDNKPRRKAVDFIKTLQRALDVPTIKTKAIERISVFAPVLGIEYDLVAKSRAWKHFPAYASWNYGTMEDNYVKGFEDASVEGDAILIGNSATFTGNHLEVFDLLIGLGITDRQIVAPLSYGDRRYARKIAEVGGSYFGVDFEPLTEFMPLDGYVATIKKCGYVIMNHVRQQAVGNIVIMLYLGARVFVRRENPVYAFFKQLGVSLSTVQELELNPGLLEVPLSAEERNKNRHVVNSHWSREKAYERTINLVDVALSLHDAKAAPTSARGRE